MTFTNHNWAITVHFGVKSVPAPVTNSVAVQQVPSKPIEPKKPTDVTGIIQLTLVLACAAALGYVWYNKCTSKSDNKIARSIFWWR